MLNPILKENLTVNNDMKILATAIFYNNIYPDLCFITNDLAQKTIARLFFDDSQIDSIIEEEDTYKGYTIKQFSDN